MAKLSAAMCASHRGRTWCRGNGSWLPGHQLWLLISSQHRRRSHLTFLPSPISYLRLPILNLLWMTNHFYLCFHFGYFCVISFKPDIHFSLMKMKQEKRFERDCKMLIYELQPTTKYFDQESANKHFPCTKYAAVGKCGKRGSCPSPLPPPPLGHILHTGATRLLFIPHTSPLHCTPSTPQDPPQQWTIQHKCYFLENLPGCKALVLTTPPCCYSFQWVQSSKFKAHHKQWQLWASSAP